MARLNILLINHYAGSVHHGMEYRPYYLAREWTRRGHRVHIVAAAASHLRAQAPQLHGQAQHDECIDGIHYTWLAARPYRGNGLARVRNMADFLTRLWHQAAPLAQHVRPDAVIASSTYPLDIWPARRIARRAGARLVWEVHDLWPLSPIELGGLSRWHPFIQLLQAAENHACRRADAVVSILPNVRAHLEAHGMAPGKLHLVPNGVDPDEWRAAPVALPPDLAAALATARAAGRCIVGYAGSHGMANGLDTLLAAATLLRDRPFTFVLVGAGPDKAALVQRAARAGLARVLFFDPVSKQQIPSLLRQFSLAYLGWRRQPLYRFGIAPNKLADYMMAARPVLHAVEAANDPVAEAACGLTVPPDDPAAVAAGLQALAALPPDAQAQMGERGQAHALNTLSYPILAQRFLTAIAGDTYHG